jgi:hypothetical protein
VTYFPYAPSVETPDGRGPDGRVTVAQSLRESTQPSTAGVLSRRILSQEPRLIRL